MRTSEIARLLDGQRSARSVRSGWVCVILLSFGSKRVRARAFLPTSHDTGHEQCLRFVRKQRRVLRARLLSVVAVDGRRSLALATYRAVECASQTPSTYRQPN